MLKREPRKDHDLSPTEFVQQNSIKGLFKYFLDNLL